MKTAFVPLLGLAGTFLLAVACSSPASRIEANPEAFARLSPDPDGVSLLHVAEAPPPCSPSGAADGLQPATG
jgi:hypothetical protein